MAVWRRHGEKIYLDNKAFACITPGLTIGEEREFDKLIDTSVEVTAFETLYNKLDAAATTELIVEQMADELTALADGWQRLTVGQVVAYLSAFEWPKHIKPNTEQFSKVS